MNNNKFGTKEWWWDLVDEEWDNLIALIEHFHPSFDRAYNYPITANRAEQARQTCLKNMEIEPNPVSAAIKARENKDAETLRDIFSQVWFGVPESYEAAQSAGFYSMCDLISDFPDELITKDEWEE